jgi:flagellar protein FlbD
MIHVTRINHASMVLNSDLIEHIETTPDTVISLTTGQKFMVLESTEEIVSKVAKFRRSICEGLSPCSWGPQVAVRPAEEAGEEGRS